MNSLGKDSIGRLLVSLAAPSIVAQIVNILYNIVDRIFIGRIDNGEIAMAGIGVTFPIILLATAFSSLFGMGGAPRCAIKFGAGDKRGAELIMGNSFTMLIITGILLTALFYVFGEKLLWFFGASNATIGYATDYLYIYLIGTIFTQIALGMNPFINTQGFARIGMATIVIGAIINTLLDPFFIFYLGMGVKGAALATILSQAISAIWVVYFLTGRKTKLKIRKAYLKPQLAIVGSIVALGISPFIMQSTESLVLISMNTQLAKFGGDIAIGAMTIMTSIMQLIIMPLQGLGQGLQPIVSFNYGAQQLDRVRKAIRLALIAGCSYNILLCSILMLFPSQFVRIFNNDIQLVTVTAAAIRVYFVGIFLFGAQIICQQIFLSLGQAKVSMFIATLRKIVLLIPLTYILPHFFSDKTYGVLLAEPISDITSALTTILLFSIFYKKHLTKKMKLSEMPISVTV